MTAEVLIVAPVLARPQNARPLVESIEETAACEWALVFVVTAGDDDELEACWAERNRSERVGIAIRNEPAGPGDYAAKIQSGYDWPVIRDSPYVLLAADDLRFHPGWLKACLATLEANPGAGVIGTNDMANPQVIAGNHSTHSLVTRQYIEERGGYVGGRGKVFYEGYDHQYVDVELVETAKARGAYAYAHGARVEHLHPLFRRDVQMDATYRRALARGREDRALFRSRQHLWENEKRAVA